MLKMRAEGLARDGYIFGEGSGFRGPHLRDGGKSIDRLREGMPEGDPWTLHDIRRTVATRLHDAGVDTLVVEDVLGHLGGARNGVAGVQQGGHADQAAGGPEVLGVERLALFVAINTILFAAGWLSSRLSNSLGVEQPAM